MLVNGFRRKAFYGRRLRNFAPQVLDPTLNMIKVIMDSTFGHIVSVGCPNSGFA